MKALRIREFGSPALATLDNVSIPTPGIGEVTVRIEAASVNPLDLKILAGYMQPVFPVAFPYTLGTDIAGVVEAVGPMTLHVQPGDRVVGRLEPSAGGGFAQTAVVPAEALCPIPVGMQFEQAAALPTAAGTAWLALFGVGKLCAGQRVLVHAAAGGVGGFAVQFAKQAGAYVMGTASSGNHPLVKRLGADEVVDYRSDNAFASLQDIDLVIDTVGGAATERSWPLIRPGGRLVSLVDHAIQGRGGVDARFVHFNHDAAVLQGIIELCQADRLQITIDSTHALDEAHAALERVAGGHACGKVVICSS